MISAHAMAINQEALDVWKESVEAGILRLTHEQEKLTMKVEKLADRVTSSDIKASALIMLWGLNAIFLGFILYKVYDLSVSIAKLVKI